MSCFRHIFQGTVSGRNHSQQKKRRRQGGNPYIKDTFTRTYACLPFPNSAKSPDMDMQKKLEAAGLGKKSITLKVSAKHNQVVEKITETFPRLANQGFVLMRAKVGGYNADLDLLKYASGRELRFYDVEELRRREICGTSILYVRPVQIKLDLTPLTREEVSFYVLNISFNNAKPIFTFCCNKANKLSNNHRPNLPLSNE